VDKKRFSAQDKAAEAALRSGFVPSNACCSTGCRTGGPAALHGGCRCCPEFWWHFLVLRWDGPIPWRCPSPRAAEGSWQDFSEAWIDSSRNKESQSQSNSGLKQVLQAYAQPKVPFLYLFCCRQLHTAVVSQSLFLNSF